MRHQGQEEIKQLVMPVRWEARWKAAQRAARRLLERTHTEMQAYFEGRDAAWQASEPGQAMQKRLKKLNVILDALSEVEE